MTDIKNPDFEYIITCHVPICPHCGGALHNKVNLEIYRCNDCNSVFKVERPGQAEHEMVCKEVFINPGDKPKEKEEETVDKVANELYKNITGEKPKDECRKL